MLSTLIQQDNQFIRQFILKAKKTIHRDYESTSGIGAVVKLGSIGRRVTVAAPRKTYVRGTIEEMLGVSAVDH